MMVSRLAQGEIMRPSFEAAVALIGVVCDQSEVSNFLQEHFPETVARFEKLSRDNAVIMNHEDLDLVLENPISFAIFDLASMHAGTSRALIQEEFGNHGIKLLDGMLQNGTLYEDQKGHIYHSETDRVNLSLNAADVLTKLRYRLQLFQTQNLGTRAARLANLSESLNEAGMTRVHQILSQAIEKVQEVRRDPKMKGNLPVYVGLMMNLVCGQPNEPTPKEIH